MRSAVVQNSKFLLTSMGAKLSANVLRNLSATLNYVRVGHWMVEHGFEFEKRVSSREAVWDAMLAHCATAQVLYLEFGVAYGNSITYWSQKLKHPKSILHGFDSFEGMPEEGGPWKKGQFNANGNVPSLADRRVTFYKGWFDSTLPTYSAPPHDLLVLNMDADLYSSTIYVLKHLRPLIKPGTLIYFDEMNHVDHEPKAFSELIEDGFEFRSLCADRTLAHAAFECVTAPSP